MFEFIKEKADSMMDELYNSAFSIMATLNITAIEVPAESGMEIETTFDETHTSIVKKTYPLGLKPIYRIKVFPIEESGLRVEEYKYTVSARVEPYDTWISCPEEVVKIGNNKTLFDYSKTISLNGTNYIIKGLIRETFGRKPILHVFLTKESSG